MLVGVLRGVVFELGQDSAGYFLYGAVPIHFSCRNFPQIGMDPLRKGVARCVSSSDGGVVRMLRG